MSKPVIDDAAKKTGPVQGASNEWTRGILSAKNVTSDDFEADLHYYPRCLNAQIHPMVKSFLSLGNKRIATRYCHLNPLVDQKHLMEVLNTTTKSFRWGGADLFNVTDMAGSRQMVIVETNSCPSGQKSLPFDETAEGGSGYHTLMKNSFLPAVAKAQAADELPKTGRLAVIFDKNPMEATGYAAAMAEMAGEDVLLAEFFHNDPNPPVRFVYPDRQDGKAPEADVMQPTEYTDRESRGGSETASQASEQTPPVVGLGVMEVRDSDGKWHTVRAAFRYVTQRPWSRIPAVTKTLIYNPIVACLAGGRNKMAADAAYDLWNKKHDDQHLEVRTPDTVRDVRKEAVPMWVESMGGHAVVKNPYSNAGQGVWTITSKEELKVFMDSPDCYDKYIVQSLIGNASWSSSTSKGKFYHTGTIPNKRNATFVADIRLMICSTDAGFRPLCVYARRAAAPLPKQIENADSWAVLGTNLSFKKSDGTFDTDSSRLVLMDVKDFNTLGIGMDDLIDGYVQTCCAVGAIDDVATSLLADNKQRFDATLFNSFNEDESFLSEVRQH